MPTASRSVITPHEQLRRQAGYTVTGLARAIGFDHAYVSRVEGQQVKPSARYRRAAANALGVSERILFGEVEA